MIAAERGSGCREEESFKRGDAGVSYQISCSSSLLKPARLLSLSVNAFLDFYTQKHHIDFENQIKEKFLSWSFDMYGT